MIDFSITVSDYLFFLKIVNISVCFFIYTMQIWHQKKKKKWSTSQTLVDQFQVTISYIAIKAHGLREGQ